MCVYEYCSSSSYIFNTSTNILYTYIIYIYKYNADLDASRKDLVRSIIKNLVATLNNVKNVRQPTIYLSTLEGFFGGTAPYISHINYWPEKSIAFKIAEFNFRQKYITPKSKG